MNITIESTIEEIIEGGTTTRGGSDKPRTLKKDLKAMKGLKKVAAYVAAVIGLLALVLIGLAVVGGIYLLAGWLLVAAIAYVTSGAVVLVPLQGAIALIVLSFIGSLFR